MSRSNDSLPAGCQEHRQPLRRARDGVVGLRQLARHTKLGHVREEGGAEGGGDADEDERPEARSAILRRPLSAVRQVLRDWERRAVLVVLSEDLVVLRSGTTGLMWLCEVRLGKDRGGWDRVIGSSSSTHPVGGRARGSGAGAGWHGDAGRAGDAG